MSREFLIDGYNLMHQFPEWQKRIQTDLTSARNRFLACLSRFAQTKRVRITVIFDGQEQRIQDSHSHGIRVLFSKPPQKADDLLKKCIAKKEGEKELIVVTSDQEIVRYAKICGVVCGIFQAFCPVPNLQRFFEHRCKIRGYTSFNRERNHGMVRTF